MKVRVPAGRLPFLLIATVLVLFSVTSTLIDFILPMESLQQGLLILVCVLCLIYIIRRISQCNLELLLLALILLLFPMVRSSWSGVNQLLFCGSVFLCLLSYQYRSFTKVFSFMVRLFLWADVFHALCTIFFRLNRSFYMTYVVRLFPSERARLIQWYNSGCMAGLTSHYSTNGMFLACGLVIAAAGFFIEKDKKRRWAILSVLLLVALLLTGKRAHPVFAAAGIFIMYVYSLSGKRRYTRRVRTLGFIIALLCVLVALYSVVPALSTFISRFALLFDSDTSADSRLELWKLAMASFKENPIFGIGWRRFKTRISIVYNGSKTYDVHNIYLQLLCETGLIGFAFYMYWFISQYLKALHFFKGIMKQGERAANQEKFLLAFALGYQTFFLIYGLTGNPLYDRMTFVPYFVSCAIVIGYEKGRDVKKITRKKERPGDEKETGIVSARI